MAEETIDLAVNYLLLEPDGPTVQLPGGREFWSQLMSGAPSDEGIQRLLASEHGRLLSTMRMDADWKNWEMHPAGDELLFMLEGEAIFVFDLPQGPKDIVLTAGRLLRVPRGIWHTAKVTAAAQLLAITCGAGTQHRPV